MIGADLKLSRCAVAYARPRATTQGKGSPRPRTTGTAAVSQTIRARVATKARHPREAVAAVVRRLVPRSEKHGFPWVHLPDGSVTFRERGFVAAESPSALLTRHNYETARIRRELEGFRAGRSLEIGCGFGRLSMTFSEFSDSHVAVDINDEALGAATVAYPHISYRHGSAEALPFPDHQFDLVTTWTVIQHVRPEKIHRVCAELIRMLAPGGTLLLCEETRHPEATGGHTWHRRVDEYEKLLQPLTLERHSYIDELEGLPGMESPGEVMIFLSRG